MGGSYFCSPGKLWCLRSRVKSLGNNSHCAHLFFHFSKTIITHRSKQLAFWLFLHFSPPTLETEKRKHSGSSCLLPPVCLASRRSKSEIQRKQKTWILPKIKWLESESRSVMSNSFCDLYTVLGILQARILEWVAVPFSRGSSQHRSPTQVSRIAGRFFASWATRKAQEAYSFSSGSCWSRNQTRASCIAGGSFTAEPLGKPQNGLLLSIEKNKRNDWEGKTG